MAIVAPEAIVANTCEIVQVSERLNFLIEDLVLMQYSLVLVVNFTDVFFGLFGHCLQELGRDMPPAPCKQQKLYQGTLDVVIIS